MVTMLHRKLFRDLSGHSLRLIAIAVIVAVGVMCFVSMQSTFINLSEARDSYYCQCRMADFWIDLRKLPLAETNRIADIDGVAEVETRVQFFSMVHLPEQTAVVNAQVLSLPDERQDGLINDILIRTGSYFSKRRQNEVLVHATFARQHALEPGDSIAIVVNSRRRSLIVAGTVISSEFAYLMAPGSFTPDPEHFGVLYVRRSFAEELLALQGAANQLVGRLASGTDVSSDTILRECEQRLEPWGVLNTTSLAQQASHQFLQGELDGLSIFAAAIPVFFLIVGALVLNVMLIRMITQQRTIIGTLKATGITDGAVFRHFLQFGLFVGIGGGLLGVGLGFLLADSMTDLYRQHFEFPSLENYPVWTVNLTGFAVAVLCAMSGSVYAARMMLEIEPAAAMRPPPPRSGGVVLFERIVWLWRGLAPDWRLTLRNLSRNRLRTGVGILSSALGAGILVCGFMLAQAMAYLVEFQFRLVDRYDVEVAFTREQGRNVLSELGQLPGVASVEPVLDVPCTLENARHQRKSTITGITPTARLTIPRDLQAQPIQIPDQGIVMSRHLAELLDVSAGERVTLTPIRGRRRPVSVRVAYIADSYMGLAAYADLSYLSDVLGEQFALTGARLSLSPGTNSVDSLNARFRAMQHIESVRLRQETIDSVTDTLIQKHWVYLVILIPLAGVIFFGAIANTSIVNLSERQRDVATLHVLGYSARMIRAQFLRESVLTGLTGTFLGLPLGWIMTAVTAAFYRNDAARLPVISAPWVWATTLTLAAVFTATAHGIIAFAIHRTDFLAALKTRE